MLINILLSSSASLLSALCSTYSCLFLFYCLLFHLFRITHRFDHQRFYSFDIQSFHLQTHFQFCFRIRFCIFFVFFLINNNICTLLFGAAKCFQQISAIFFLLLRFFSCFLHKTDLRLISVFTSEKESAAKLSMHQL